MEMMPTHMIVREYERGVLHVVLNRQFGRVLETEKFEPY